MRARRSRGTLAALRSCMTAQHIHPESGKVGSALAWLLGVPLPILLIVYLTSRC
jgi:hypothetical protein